MLQAAIKIGTAIGQTQRWFRLLRKIRWRGWSDFHSRAVRRGRLVLPEVKTIPTPSEDVFIGFDRVAASPHNFRMKIFYATLALIACAANSLFAQKVFRDRVEPHWFAGADGVTNQFWYRVNLPGGKTEFVTINAETGARQTASHRENSGDDTLPVLRAPHPSRDSAVDTEVTFENRLAETVKLFWIDSRGGHVPYGSIPAGEKHTQHTFVGHVWLVTSANTNNIAVFEADDMPGVAVIDGRAPEGPRHRQKRRTEEHPSAPRRDEISPDGKWEAFVRDANLFLRESGTTNETQLTTDGCTTNSYARNEQANRAIEMEYDRRDPETPTPEVFWSPDSKHLVAMRHQPGMDRRVYLIESSPADQVQPKLDSYPYLKPGDNVPIRKPHLFEIGTPSTVSASSEDQQHRAETVLGAPMHGKFPSATRCSKIRGALITCAGTRIRRGSHLCSTSAGIRRCAFSPWTRRPAR